MIAFFFKLQIDSLKEDFEELRQTAHKNGWFKVNPFFFIAHLGGCHLTSFIFYNFLHVGFRIFEQY